MSIDYELAKELKDAGFPQQGNIGAKYYSFIAHPRMGIPAQYVVTTQISEDAQFDKVANDYTRIPALEELIEPCIDDKFLLIHDEDGWYAENRPGMSPSDCKTPLEAVARLWLDINKKV